MTAVQEVRSGGRDGLLDQLDVNDALGEELFSVVDALDGSASLRRALTDPGAAEQARTGLVEALWGNRLQPGTVQLLLRAVQQRWSTPAGLADALEAAAVRAELRLAQAGGGLEATDAELFSLLQVIISDPQLRSALSDRQRSVKDRAALVGDLLDHKVGPSTLRLARRAVRARKGNVETTLQSYVREGAALGGRELAVVTAARPLTDDQRHRLAEQLTRIVGAPVEIVVAINPAVLGGIRVEIGDRVIEGTVANRLEQARRQLA